MGFARGGRLHAEASLLAGTSSNPVQGTGDTTSRLGLEERLNSTIDAHTKAAKKQEELVETYARTNRDWYENTNKTFTKKYGKALGKGTESEIWYNNERNVVIKAKTLSHYPDLERTLDSITLHNTHFPETAQKVIGFGKNADGEFVIVEEQPFIKLSKEKFTRSEIADILKEKGFFNSPSSNVNFESEDTRMNDMHEDNVVKGIDGKAYAIDSDTSLKGGTREIGNEIVPIYKFDNTIIRN